MPPFYPEEELERHGIPPDAFGSPGCYVLALDRPDGFDALRERWYAQYDVSVPEPLVSAVDDKRDLAYVGAAKSLLDRLHDHVDGDVRRVGLLAVCPPTGVRAVFPDDDPWTAETQYAYAYSAARPNVVCYANGEWFP